MAEPDEDDTRHKLNSWMEAQGQRNAKSVFGNRQTFVNIVAGLFKGMPTDVACEEMSKIGVVAMKMRSMTGLREENIDPATEFTLTDTGKTSKKTLQFTVEKDHPIGSAVTIFSPCSIRATNAVVVNPTPQPQYGKDTREIMVGMLGYTSSDVDMLVSKGTVAERWS